MPGSSVGTSRLRMLAHVVELIVELELPLVHNSFLLSGLPCSQVAMLWLTQYFLNFLDWPEISNFVALAVVLGADFQVYFCVAILHHLQSGVLESASHGVLGPFLAERPIQSFRVGDHLDFLQSLQLRHRPLVDSYLAMIVD
eukprot:TRINITY_DN12794_c0_g1_i1.p1 TRINITY_DN12794_c0_g1~~TRINITY_DN12794_c0_g1_i1.p1  ORF type:complete len:142 (-),score=20.59 TRINITY_DN12794_c0_g1_i1:120-545(-)